MGRKQACDICHKRKIQCDSIDPEVPCNWCAHHGLACTFTRIRKSKRTMSSRVENKEVKHNHSGHLQHGRRFENELAQTTADRQRSDTVVASSSSQVASPSHVDNSEKGPSIHTPTKPWALSALPSHRCTAPRGSGDTASVAFCQIHFSGFHFGSISHLNGMPILSEEGRRWISSRTGEQDSLDNFRATTTHHSCFSSPVTHRASSHSFPEELFRLPDSSIAHQTLEVFRCSPYRVVFPLVDPVLFRRIITLAYEPQEGPFPAIECITAKCCVFAFLSIAYIFWDSRVDMQHMDSDAFAMKAYQLLPDVVEVISIVGLQAISMLHLHQTLTGRLQSAAMLHAVVCRAMFTLGGHLYVPIKPYSADVSDEERESRQLRLLFWLCYSFDKDIALRLNQPPLLSDDYCDLTLPEGYANSYLFPSRLKKWSLTDSFDEDENFVPLFPIELRLSRLKGEAARLLYSAQAAKKTEAELFHDIRTLDDELEKWRQSLVPEFRPSLSISQSSVPNISSLTPISMRYIFLHLEYHHVMMTIHRASGRCAVPSSKGRPESRDPNGGLQSSIDLTLEAGRSTLIFLKTVTNGMVGHAFWATVFYPTAAMMVLFLNVLKFPMAPQAESDLDLLSSAAETIRSIPTLRMTPRETNYIQSMDRLVADLVRLGNSAIALERKTQNSGHHSEHSLGT